MGDRAVTLTLSRPEMAADQIERLAERAPLDAIVAVDDGGTRAAAVAAKRLGLRGNDPSAVGRARDKAAMREALAQAGVRQPAFGEGVGFPRVLKPLALSGSQGVIRADTPEESRQAAARIRAILGDPEAPILVEEFVA